MHSHLRGTISSRPTALAIVGLLGLFHASAAQATLVVRLEQIGGPAVAVSGTQTFITAALKVSGSLASPLTTTAFGGNLSWTASGTGVTNSNLYTVTSSGLPVVGGGAMNVNSAGFLYYNGLAVPTGSMNTTGLDSTFQRYVGIDADANYYPTLSGSFADITVATINFAVSAGISSGEFDFTLNGLQPNRGFFNDQFEAVSFTNGGGTIVVVPEPTMPAVFVVFGLIAVGYRARGRLRAAKGAAAA
jgi:hypothetical protein